MVLAQQSSCTVCQRGWCVQAQKWSRVVHRCAARVRLACVLVSKSLTQYWYSIRQYSEFSRGVQDGKVQIECTTDHGQQFYEVEATDLYK